MRETIHSLIRLLTDDTKLVSIAKLDVQTFKLDKDQLVKWTAQWQMSFNIKKRKYIFLKNQSLTEISLQMNYKSICKKIHRSTRKNAEAW